MVVARETSLAGAAVSAQAARSADDSCPTFGTPAKPPTMAWQENTEDSGPSVVSQCDRWATSPKSPEIADSESMAAANAAATDLTGKNPDTAATSSKVNISSLKGPACFYCEGVPQSEVQRWWSEVANEIQLITEAVDAKLDLWRARMAEKDQVIKRLYVKVKQLSEPAKSAAPAAAQASSGTRSPLRAATRSGRLIPGSPSHNSRPLMTAQSVDGFQGVIGTRSGRSGSLSPSNRPLLGASLGASDGVNGRSPEVRPSALTTQTQSPQAARKPQKREAAERVQILYLRQEVAQLRRQNAELQNQVRAGDLQVENLSVIVKDLQDSQRSRTSGSGIVSNALPQQTGPGSGTSTPVVNPMPATIASPTNVSNGSGPQPALQSVGPLQPAQHSPVTGEHARAYGHRRLSMDSQSGVIVASRSSAANQAQRYARAAEVGERGSASRPSSAFQRHKEQMAATNRRIIVAAPQASHAPGGSQMTRMFSPRSRQLQPNRSVASCAALREPAAASIAQAAQAVAAQTDSQPQVRAGVAGLASAGGVSAASAFRSASVDNRARTRISTARRSLRRH